MVLSLSPFLLPVKPHIKPLKYNITGETLPTYIDEAPVRRYGIFGATFITGIKSEAISTDMTEVALWAPPPIKQLKSPSVN